jgi:hypothetical protein
MTNSLPWYRWPIEIDGLPNLKMVIFHSYGTVYQRVNPMMNCNYGHKPATCPSLPTFIVSTVMLAAQVAGFVRDFVFFASELQSSSAELQ